MNRNREDVNAYYEAGFAVFVLVTIHLYVKGMTDLTLRGSFSVSLPSHRRGPSCCGYDTGGRGDAGNTLVNDAVSFYVI